MLKNRIFYAIFYLFVVIFYFFFADYISLVLLVIATVLPLLTVGCAVYSSKRLQLKISTDKLVAERGEPITFRMGVVNYSRLPVPFLKVDFRCRSFYEDGEKNETLMLSLTSRSETQSEILVVCDRCCIAELRTFSYKITDFFGLYSKKREAQLAVETVVVPRPIALNVPMEFREIYSAESEVFSKKKPGDDCSEVFQVREYRDGDSLRQLHHKLSNKLDRLMVKDFSMPVRSAVTVIAEYSISADDSDAQGVDTLLDILYSLADGLKENHVSFTLIWFDSVENKLAETVVSEDSDMFAFVRELLHHKPAVGTARTIRQYNISRTPQANENLFYVTPMIDVGEIAKIINAPQPEKVTVLYTGNEETDMPGIARVRPDSVDTVSRYLV